MTHTQPILVTCHPATFCTQKVVPTVRVIVFVVDYIRKLFKHRSTDEASFSLAFRRALALARSGPAREVNSDVTRGE